MRISIFASIWAQNLWDELILKNEIKLLEKKYWEDTKFSVFTYDKKNIFYKKENVKYYEFFPIGIKNAKNIIKNKLNFIVFIFITLMSDLIVIWWWWIIYDNENQLTKSPLKIWMFRTFIFRMFMKKIEFFRLWLNIKDKNNYKKIKFIFKKANYISVRDNYSFELLNELWINSTIEKDPVFYDKGSYITNKSLIWVINSTDLTTNKLSSFDFNWITVWLALRSWYLVEKSNLSMRMEEWKIREIINYITSNGWKIILLPHSFHKNDILANDFLFLNKFLHKNVSIESSMEDVYNVYKNKKIDICFSMRLHSIILSHVYEIPFLWISYSKKTDEVLKTLK